jgi:hypothetical protein
MRTVVGNQSIVVRKQAEAGNLRIVAGKGNPNRFPALKIVARKLSRTLLNLIEPFLQLLTSVYLKKLAEDNIFN